MWPLVLSIGLKLLDLFISDKQDRDARKKRFRDFIEARSQDSKRAAKAKKEMDENFERLKEEPKEP